ncbi:DBH-like monooxygenase protein 2 isoform X4 [Arvicanthis niloticus]|uniref:DBH-like monooxygenase protein 2 isoform X4 n=1 Tax=Arvicanthis niloticus TaxID=61156 RepID=UPI00402BC25B
MACVLFRLFLLLVLAAFSQGKRLGPTSPLRYSRFLDPSHAVFLRWDFDYESEIITFELQVQTTGWIGLGITDRYTFVGSDLVVGGVLPNGNVYFSDQHLLDEDTLEQDGSQDAELLKLTEDSSSTTMRFSRPFRSCDPHDHDITSDTMRVLAAYGLDDIPKMSREHTFVKSIFLLQILQYDDQDAPEDTIIHDLKISNSYQFPDDVGISIGTPFDPQWIRLEIHYSNFQNLPGIRDTSGMRLYYTSHLRKYDMGVLQLGISVFPIHFIPPGAEAFLSYGLCKTDKFEEMNGAPVADIYVSACLLHTHLAGRSLQAVQYRNGTQLQVVCKDFSYDFNLQESRDLPHPVVIKPGDELLIECHYQTLDRDFMTFGGASTINEMCLIFIFYYPRINISSCMGYPDIIYVTNELGEEASENPMENLMVLNNVEWTPENIKKAEKACKESQQTVLIKTIDEEVENTTGWIPDIIPTPRGSCLESSGGKVEPQDKTPAGFRAVPLALSGSHTPTLRHLPMVAVLFLQGSLSWFLAMLQTGV